MYQLAVLLMELDAEDEASHLLVADALYRLGRLDDAHKALLVALSRRPQAAPVLARLALLQLRRGFFYDANQVRAGPRLCTPQPGLGAGKARPSPGLRTCALVLRVVAGIGRRRWPRPQGASRTQ